MTDADFAAMIADEYRTGGTAPFMPTPAEIAEECRLIRAEWSPDEEQKRRAYGSGRVAWQVPGIDQNSQQTDRVTVSAFQTSR